MMERSGGQVAAPLPLPGTKTLVHSINIQDATKTLQLRQMGGAMNHTTLIKKNRHREYVRTNKALALALGAGQQHIGCGEGPKH